MRKEKIGSGYVIMPGIVGDPRAKIDINMVYGENPRRCVADIDFWFDIPEGVYKFKENWNHEGHIRMLLEHPEIIVIIREQKTEIELKNIEGLDHSSITRKCLDVIAGAWHASASET